MSVADTVATATNAIVIGGFDILAILPYLGGGVGTVIVVLGWMYRDVIKEFLSGINSGRDAERKLILTKVSDLENTLKLHTEKEDDRFGDIESRLVEVETKQVNTSEVMKIYHEQTITELGRIYEQISMLTKALLEQK